MPQETEVERWTEYERLMWAVGLDHYRGRIERLPFRGRRVLDLGCGPGQWSAAALRHGMSVVGCDKRITKKAAMLTEFSDGFSPVVADAVALPFSDASFDLVLCHLVLPYVAVEVCVAEIARVLRTDGVLNGVCHGPGYYLLRAWRFGWKRDAIRPLLVLVYTIMHRLAGLSVYRYETFQNPTRLRGVLEHSGFEILSVVLGGHPTMPEVRFGGLPVFFEFTARKRAPLVCEGKEPTRGASQSSLESATHDGPSSKSNNCDASRTLPC